MALIDCRGVSLAYDGKTVVSGLDFQVNSGDYLCILGENGSGKSTLIKGLLRLKEPVCGSITYGDGLKKNEIGYLPQQTVIQRDFPATVYEVVLSGCLSSLGKRCFYGKKEKSAALSNMEKLGKTHAIGSFRAVSSSECFLQGLSAQQKSCCFSTNRLPGWTPL